jgi:hypothetical protein
MNYDGLLADLAADDEAKPATPRHTLTCQKYLHGHTCDCGYDQSWRGRLRKASHILTFLVLLPFMVAAVAWYALVEQWD